MNNAISNIQIDFELEQYIQDLSMKSTHSLLPKKMELQRKDKFTEHIMEILSEAGETEGIGFVIMRKENRWENIQFKINGYAIRRWVMKLLIFLFPHYKDTNEHYTNIKT